MYDIILFIFCLLTAKAREAVAWRRIVASGGIVAVAWRGIGAVAWRGIVAVAWWGIVAVAGWRVIAVAGWGVAAVAVSVGGAVIATQFL